MESRQSSAPGPPPTSPVKLNKHLTQAQMKSLGHQQYNSLQELPAEKQTDKVVKNNNEKHKVTIHGGHRHHHHHSLPRKKNSIILESAAAGPPIEVDVSEKISTPKSKSCSALGTPPTTPTHLSLPMKLAKLKLNSSGDQEIENKDSVPKILINDEVEPRKDLDSMPRRPLKRKSQDTDRNFLSECGYAAVGGGFRSSDFWLPKVKVTPSMVNQLNAEILANIHISSVSATDGGQDERERVRKIREALQHFFMSNQVFGPAERIVEVIETLSTRILNPSDDEAWTILTAEQVISVEFAAVWPQNVALGCSVTNVKIRGRCPIVEIRRILTDTELTVVHLVGPEIEIVLGDSAKTEKLISSVLVSALRLPKCTTVPMEITDTQNQQQQSAPSTLRSRSSQSTQRPEFLEVTHLPILDLPNLKRIFQSTYPDEKQVYHSAVVVVTFEELAREIEVPVRIQITSEGNEFRSSVLKLVGSVLSFHNPMKTFFAFNPGPNLTKIDVSDRRKFTIERIEAPKPNSLLMMSNDNYYVIETGDSSIAEEIFQRISSIQNICTSGIGKQVAHIFITQQSVLALRNQTYESIFQEPVMNIVKIHASATRENTCVLELESTEAMDFISSGSPCWSLTFASIDAKRKFMERLLLVASSLTEESTADSLAP